MNNTQDSDICKEFLKASQKGDLKSLKDLVSKNDLKDWTIFRHVVSGDTALHLAIREGHTLVTHYLCEAWDKPCFKTEVANKDMKRPLHDAAQFSRPDILEYLLRLGAEVDPLKRADWTPLMLACTKAGPEAAQCVNMLLKYGAASNLQNKDGWTSLMLACRAGNLDAVKILVKESTVPTYNDTIFARSKNGRSPLHVAAFHGHRDIIDFLLSKKSDLINCRDSSGSTPLLESVKSGDIDTLIQLINFKADFKTVDNVGQNILHFAAISGNIEMIKFIYKNKFVDIESHTAFGITPLMLAEKNKQFDAIEVLKTLKR